MDAGRWFGITLFFTFFLWFSYFIRHEPSVPASVRMILPYVSAILYLAFFGYFIFDQYKDRKVRSKTDEELLSDYTDAIEPLRLAWVAGDSRGIDSYSQTMAINFFEIKRRNPNVPMLVQLMEDSTRNVNIRIWTIALLVQHTALKDKALKVLDEISRHQQAEAPQAENLQKELDELHKKIR